MCSTEIPRGSSLAAIKTQQLAKDEEERTKSRRRRSVLVMILQYLSEAGYTRSLEALAQESSITLRQFSPADNIDLTGIFTQFEEFYEIKFGRRPKFYAAPPIQNQSNVMEMGVPHGAAPPNSRRRQSNTTVPARNSSQINGLAPPELVPSSPDAPAGSMQIGGKAIELQKRRDEVTTSAEEDLSLLFHGRSGLPPPPKYPTQELNELAAAVHRDILDASPKMRFSDIAELDAAKQLLQEAVVMPLKYPQLFQGLGRPWQGILLYGPPGTGKTMLAKAVATECRTAFFNISTATIVSKWRGDSEKLVRMLFDLAVHYAPATIFLDELDAVMSARGGADGGTEHEASRRMKTEFLVQMDGMMSRSNGRVFVLAASNLPWELDPAVLRRFEKRLYVPLPGITARQQMLSHHLRPYVKTGVQNQDAIFASVAARTEGFSGADIEILCREATMRSVRTIIRKLESTNARNISNVNYPEVSVSADDLEQSLNATRPSGTGGIPLKSYSDWDSKFGSTLSLN